MCSLVHGLVPRQAQGKEGHRDLSGAAKREREVPGMLRSTSDFCTDGSGGLGEVEGPVDNPDLLSKLQGCPHLGAAGRAGTCWSFGPGIAADVPALFLS